MRTFISFLVLLSILWPSLADACMPCAGWWDWGHREQICASPSESLLDDEIACLCSGAGTANCTAWCAGYASCEASGDPSCVIDDDPACDAVMSVGGACHSEAFACGADHTSCVTCANWFAGGDVQGLCPDTGVSPHSYTPASNLSNCACTSCSAACAGACADGYLHPALGGFSCGVCIGSVCSTQYGACSGA